MYKTIMAVALMYNGVQERVFWFETEKEFETFFLETPWVIKEAYKFGSLEKVWQNGWKTL